MAFKNILGQDEAIRLLAQNIANDNIAGTYLFVGMAGTGRKTTAIQFAKELNCLTSKGSACEKCKNCTRISEGNYPDLMRIAKKEGSQTTAISQVKELKLAAYKKAYESNYKIFILEEAETLSIEASNALLKLLEEPPLNTITILIASDIRKLLSTIVSRSRVIKFHPLDAEIVRRILVELNWCDSTQAKIIAQMSHGNLQNAKLYLDQDYIYLREIVEKFITPSSSILDEKSELFSLSRDELLRALDIMLNYYRDMVLYKVSQSKEEVFNPDKENILKDVACYETEETLLESIEAIIVAANRLRASANQKLTVSQLFYSLKNQGESSVRY